VRNRCQIQIAREISSGKELPVTQAYWFAWIAFYPGTRLIQPSGDSPD
jgi:hypothetical protein